MTSLPGIRHTVRKGSIVIMQVNGRDWFTVKRLPFVIEPLKDKGLILINVSQLIELEFKP